MMATVKAVARSSLARQQLNKAPITITPAAKTRLTELSSSTTGILSPSSSSSSSQSSDTNTLNIPKTYNSKYIKISVKTKGCSGSAYTLDFTDKKNALDEQVKVTDNLTLLIESKALLSILGSEMDFVETKLSDGFVFLNPNVKETCGCGMSFIV